MYKTNQTSSTSTKTPSHRYLCGGYYFSFAPVLLLFAFVWPFSGGKDVQMLAGEANPAARGTVHLHVGDNKNTEMDLKAESMPAASALTPSRNAYIVWIQPPDSGPQNLGQITPDKDQKAELKTQTTYKRFKIFITAEDQAQLQSPQGPTILSADVTEEK